MNSLKLNSIKRKLTITTKLRHYIRPVLMKKNYCSKRSLKQMSLDQNWKKKFLLSIIKRNN